MGKILIPGGNGGGGGISSDDVTALKNQVLEGTTALTADSNDEVAEGELSKDDVVVSAGGNIQPVSSREITPIRPSTSDITIPTGFYTDVPIVAKAVTTSGITAANIKKGAVVQVGDTDDPTRITSVTGTYSTPSSGQTAVTAANLRTGYSAFVNGGSEIKGSMPNATLPTAAVTTKPSSTAKATITPGTAAKYIEIPKGYVSANGYYTVSGDADLVAAKIKKGVNIFGVAGTFEGYVPVTGDVYYNGTWGSGYSKSSMGTYSSGLNGGGNWDTITPTITYQTTSIRFTNNSKTYVTPSHSLYWSNFAINFISATKTISITFYNPNSSSKTVYLYVFSRKPAASGNIYQGGDSTLTRVYINNVALSATTHHAEMTSKSIAANSSDTVSITPTGTAFTGYFAISNGFANGGIIDITRIKLS